MVILGTYFGIGALFSIYFVIDGASRLDPLIKESKFTIRLLLAPGALATWPFLLLKLIKVRGEGRGVVSLKLHRNIWTVFGIILPVMIYFSIKNLAFQQEAKLEVVKDKTQNTKEIKSAENEFIRASLYDRGGTDVQLELTLKTPMKQPVLAVYVLDSDGNKGEFMGQLGPGGMYYFQLQPDIYGILIYDTLKEKSVTKLTF